MRNKTRSIIESRDLVSVMNNTKWTQLRAAIESKLPWSPAYQLKSLLSNQPEPEFFEDKTDYYGDWVDPPLWHDTFDIEWIRISTVLIKYRGRLIEPEYESLREELCHILEELRTPHTLQKDSITVYGYIDSTINLASI